MKATILGLTLVLAGCVAHPPVDNDDDNDNDDDVGVDLDPTVNALTPAQLFNSTINANTLDTANATAMAETWDNRMTLTYAIGCALAADHRVHVIVDGIPHAFAGLFGLADSWTSSPLTAPQRHSVSSCVLARLNEYGLSVKLALRIASPEGGVVSSELGGYTLQEGAFFGEIFSGYPRYAGACSGTGTAPWTRQCAQPGASGAGCCGLDHVGACAEACTLQNGYYVSCIGNDGVTYAESTTAYLAP